MTVTLPDAATIATMTPDDLAALLVQLAALHSAIAARLATAATVRSLEMANEDVLLDVRQVAALLKRSESWVRKTRTLPGRVQLAPGGRVRWRRSELVRWAR